MAEMNHLCGHANCQHQACVFGFLKGVGKQAVCQEHISTLSDQGIPTFEIEAYQCTETAKDYLQYQQRREQVESGLKSIALLESRCDADLLDVGKLLETDKASKEESEEISAQVQQCCKAMKHQLKGIISRLRELVKEKNFELNAEDSTICGVTEIGPLFRLAHDEDSHSYLEVTETGALVESAQAELAKLRVEAKRDAQEGQNWRTAKRILRQFAASTTQFDVQIVVQGYVKRAIEARIAGNYVKALKKLQQGRMLLQQWKQEDALLCMHLGQIRAYLGSGWKPKQN